MPTSRPRHVVTESNELARALDAAATRWPGSSRARLLVQLALDRHRAAQQAHDERRRRRLAALREHSAADRRLRTGLPGSAARGMAGVIVLDAGVLIAYVDGEDNHHRRADTAAARKLVTVRH